MAVSDRSSRKLLLWSFVTVGILAIIAGGMAAAFAAKAPTTFAVWMSAYLVLVAGVAQIAFGLGAYALAPHPAKWLIMAAFAVYSLGNLGVIAGTGLKAESYGIGLVDTGGILLAVAMILLVCMVRGAKKSWLLISYYAVIAVILVSMPIGLFLVRH